jgi:fumarylacetoacetate (FAA) hydrolase
MRFATVFDSEANEPRPVFELPGGRRVELRELFRPDGGETLSDEALGEMPLYFADLAKTVEFLEDVADAIRQWSRERAEAWKDAHAATIALERGGEPTRTDRMPFLPPVPVVRNLREFDAFEAHVKSWRAQMNLPSVAPAWSDVPTFAFGSGGSIVGHESAVSAPADCEELDYGLRLAAIIGRGGRNVPAGEAWRHIAGFTIVNAFVARDVERREVRAGAARAKSRDFATAVGPYLIPLSNLRDRIDEDGRLHLAMRALVNGNELSRGDACAMHFTWPQLVEHASRDADLFPGDLLLGGVIGTGSILDLGGQPAANYLRPGDVVELEVERLGILRTPIVKRSGGGATLSSGAIATAVRAPLAV